MLSNCLNATIASVHGQQCGPNVTDGQLFVLLHYSTGNIARSITDGNKATAKFLVAHSSRGSVSLAHLTCDTLLKGYSIGSPVADINKGVTPDDIIKAELAKINVLTDSSVAIRNITWLVGGIGQNYSPDIEFAWIELSSAEAADPGHAFHDALRASERCLPIMGVPCQRLGISNHTRATLPPPSPRIHGQDIRLLPLAGARLFVQFTVIPSFVQPFNPSYRTRHTQMGAAFIGVSGNGSMVYEEVYNVIRVGDGDGSDQKNFVPFVYMNGTTQEVLLLQRINPLHVIALDRKALARDLAAGQGDKFILPSRAVSTGPFVANLTWDYGAIRGGTPALPYTLADGLSAYLAFFHSSRLLPGNTMRTYFMGAYVFSSHPPFRLLAISRHPIVHERLYSGPWSAVKARAIDYTVFPSSFFFDCGLGRGDECDSIVLTVGFQDLHGLSMRLSAAEVVRAMEPIL